MNKQKTEHDNIIKEYASQPENVAKASKDGMFREENKQVQMSES